MRSALSPLPVETNTSLFLTECGCNNVGSNSKLCDLRTGKCPCKEGVVEEKCTRCEDNYFGFDSGTGCLPCLCNQRYSSNLQCDNNGVCPCLPGVKPTKCHECNDTSFNLTSQGNVFLFCLFLLQSTLNQ